MHALLNVKNEIELSATFNVIHVPHILYIFLFPPSFVFLLCVAYVKLFFVCLEFELRDLRCRNIMEHGYVKICYQRYQVIRAVLQGNFFRVGQQL